MRLGIKRKRISKNAKIIIEDDTQYDHMPDYKFMVDGENVLVRRKDVVVETEGERMDSGGSLCLAAETMTSARTHAPGWDVYHLEREWRAWVGTKGIRSKIRIATS